MSQKREFIRRYLALCAGDADAVSMSALYRAYGISRPTGYRLVARHEAAGDAGLCERSRRAHHSPHRTPARMERRVVRLRRQHPCWGGRKIRHRLLSDGVANPPAVSTITGILRRAATLRDGRAQYVVAGGFQRASPDFVGRQMPSAVRD